MELRGSNGTRKMGWSRRGECGVLGGRPASLIDITAPISARQPPLKIGWSKRPETIVNNGHTIQFDFAQGNTLHMGDRKYALKAVPLPSSERAPYRGQTVCNGSAFRSRRD